jgi:hypothetical protein
MDDVRAEFPDPPAHGPDLGQAALREQQQPRCQVLQLISRLCAWTPVAKNRVRMAGGATDVVLECRRDPGTEGFDNVEDLQAGNGLIALRAVDRQEPQVGSVHAASGPCDGTVDMWTSQNVASTGEQTVIATQRTNGAPKSLRCPGQDRHDSRRVRAATLLSGKGIELAGP